MTRTRNSPTLEDQLRLREGARALALVEPQTRDEIVNQLEIIDTGLLALQSLDDLGSDEANAAAWQNMTRLQSKFNRLKKQLESMPKASAVE